jgi:phosphohistidine phosphatase
MLRPELILQTATPQWAIFSYLKVSMRALTLIRHAKSSWSEPGLTDSARPLAPRGIAAGPVMAGWLAEHLIKPDAVRCSTAVRTRATWAMLADVWGPDTPPCGFDDTLYMASAEELLRKIRQTSDDQAHLMIIGHNPGLHELAMALVGPSKPADRQALTAKFPTAAVAALTFDITTWSAVRRGEGQLLHFVSPRRLTDARGD